MQIAGPRLALIVVLIIAGLYFLIFHMNLPLNHESVGLGKGDVHLAHDALGIVLILGAVVVWRKSRTVPAPAQKVQPSATS